MEPTKRVLIVEDDAHIAELLRMHLHDEGYAVTHAADGHAGVRKLERGSWDALILDLMLPGVDGLEICRRARAMVRYTPIIIISARASEVHRILGLELGADDYLAKPFSPRELAARIKALLRRAAMPAPAAAAPTPFVDDETGQRITLHGQVLPLTRREYRLLSHLLRGAGRIHARDALLAAAWGDDSESTDRTVDTHIKTLRAKLREVDAGREYISTHRGMGYCLDT